MNQSGTYEYTDSFLGRLGVDFGIGSRVGGVQKTKSKNGKGKSSNYSKKCHGKGKGKGGSGNNGSSGKCKKKVRALDLVWKGSKAVKVSGQDITTVPVDGKVAIDGSIQIKFSSYDNDQYLDIYDDDSNGNKYGTSVFHVSW